MFAPNAQWKRYAQVVVGKGGKGLSIDKLKIKFEINKTIQPTPNTALIKIYNLSPDHETLVQHEFDEVILNAGYEGNVRVVFRGNIKHVFKYKDKTDYVTEIEAADGDRDFRTSVMNETLSAGTTTSHILSRAVASFTNTLQGYSNIEESTHIRGVVLSGNTRDILHNLAREAGANWSVQDGQLTIVKTDSTLPHTAIAINSNTGLLDAPEINDKGIGLKCLMNPDILINGKVQLNNNNIKVREKSKSLLSSSSQKLVKEKMSPVRLDPDGIYKVISLQHRGSNREQEWITELLCIGLGQPIPAPETSVAETEGEGIS